MQHLRTYAGEVFFVPPDECVRSILNRFCILNGCSIKEALSNVTKRQKARVHPSLPSFLNGLSALLRRNAQELLENHTLFELYRPFLSVDAANDLNVAMLGESPVDVAKAVRWGSNQLRVRKSLRWCPQCVRTDIRDYGFSYWHLAHQIPAVAACAVHGCELVDSILPTSGWDILSDLPNEIGCIQASNDAQCFAKFTSRALTYLRATKKLKYCQPQYTRAADRMGVLTKKGNLRRKRLMEAMQSWWLDPLTEYAGLSEKCLYRKIAKLFHGRQFQSQHIVTNLLVLFNVFDNGEESFGENPNTQSVRLHASDSAESARETRLHYTQQIEYCPSLNAASQTIGKSRSYVKRLSMLGGLRPLQSSEYVRNDVTGRLLSKAKAGYSSQKIAQELSVKKSYVEFCLSCSPETQKFRKLLTHRRRQVQHRARINGQVSMSANQSRTTIAKKQSAAFHWLYKHDRKWLYKVLPPARKPILPASVDWSARDQMLLSVIREVADKQIKPKSWAGLDKFCRGCSYFSKYRHKLPKSSALAARQLDLHL